MPVPQIVTSGVAFNLCIVELSNQRRQDVRLREIEVVVLPIQVGRHRRDEVRSRTAVR